MMWTLRLLALASTTVCGVAFLIDIVTLLLNYNYEHHRFPPFVVPYISATIWMGLCFLCSGILYLYLVRTMRPISK
ncbi:MAG TPA: hypothetical protein VNX26_17700 [Candidatus Acidoferrum sp.]|jgi:hypothetical protein|nr:hypothetical protein [Candidatus Acidoferrum sp.]